MSVSCAFQRQEFASWSVLYTRVVKLFVPRSFFLTIIAKILTKTSNNFMNNLKVKKFLVSKLIMCKIFASGICVNLSYKKVFSCCSEVTYQKLVPRNVLL